MWFKFIKVNLLYLVLVSSVLARNNTFEKREFADIFGRACAAITNLPNEEVNNNSAVNSFRVLIIGQHNIAGYGVTEVITAKQPAAILNFGNRFEYAVITQSIPDIFQEKILEELEDYKEEFLEEYTDINPSWSFENNQIIITANYYYDDVDGGDIKNRLVYLMRLSQRVVTQILNQTIELKWDRKDDLEDMELEYLSRFDLNCLMPTEEFEEWAKDDSSVKEGVYGYTLRDIDVEIRNHGNRIELIYEDFIPANFDDEKIENLLSKLSAIANENKPEGNPSIEVIIPEDLSDNIWVKAEYSFNKTYTGEDFIGYFEDFMEDFLDEMNMEFDDLVDEMDN
jgi:hypothetical protein